MSPTDARGYVYEAWFVTSFRPWNHIDISSYKKVICTSDFSTAILDIGHKMVHIIVLRSALNEKTFEALYKLQCIYGDYNAVKFRLC